MLYVYNMEDLYRETILDHYKHPRNFGTLPKATHKSHDNLVSCGDDIAIDLLVENEVVKNIAFGGVGCAISMASASMLTEMVMGKKVADLFKLSRDDILNMLGVQLTPTRVKCALLSLEVLHKALGSEK